MRNQITSLLAIFVVLLAWGPSVHAGCKNSQMVGSWDVVFSDGNSCRLVLDKEGNVLTNPDLSLSTCLDPFQGTTSPDWGSYEVEHDCSILSFELYVDDTNVEMYGRLTPSRQIGAGFYVALDSLGNYTKGSFNIMPVK